MDASFQVLALLLYLEVTESYTKRSNQGQEKSRFGVRCIMQPYRQLSLIKSVQLIFSVSPPVQSTSPVHYTNPVIVDGHFQGWCTTCTCGVHKPCMGNSWELPCLLMCTN